MAPIDITGSENKCQIKKRYGHHHHQNLYLLIIMKVIGGGSVSAYLHAASVEESAERELEFSMYYSDLLNSSVTRQNINNIPNAAGIARHNLLPASCNSCITHHRAASLIWIELKKVPHQTAWRTNLRRFCAMFYWRWSRIPLAESVAALSCYIAGVRDAICVKEFYYLWLVIVNDLFSLLYSLLVVYTLQCVIVDVDVFCAYIL